MDNTFQIQHSLPPNPNVSIDILETSIQTLLKNWIRRKRWQQCFSPQVGSLEKSPWRNHLANFLESMSIRLLSLVLLLLDLVLTVLDLSSSLLSCTSEKKDREENVVYHWGGIAILGLLTLKSCCLVVALGGTFFRRPGMIVDSIVVSVALMLELLLETEGAGLVVVVSLWRVVRVIESAFELSDEAIEAQIEGIISQFEVLRNENERLQDVIVEKDRKIAELEEALNQR